MVEIDRARGKSKIEVVHINCTEILTENQCNQVRELINGWIDESEIEWFERPLDEIRDEKIDDILKT